jgi:hypothetical protein
MPRVRGRYRQGGSVRRLASVPRQCEWVVLLNTFTPDLYVQYFRDLHAMLAAPAGQLTPQAMADTMARYGTEPATEYAA